MKESKLDIDRYVNELAQTGPIQSTSTAEPEFASLESVLKGRAVELWSDSADQLFIVADEEDATRVRAPRGTVYTAAELRHIVRINDPAVVREIQQWKREFNGVVREAEK